MASRLAGATLPTGAGGRIGAISGKGCAATFFGGCETSGRGVAGSLATGLGRGVAAIGNFSGLRGGTGFDAATEAGSEPVIRLASAS